MDRDIKSAARRLTAMAVKAGLLPAVNGVPCKDCGVSASVYDHRDYGSPLTVDAVCQSCNVRRGIGAVPSDIEGALDYCRMLHLSLTKRIGMDGSRGPVRRRSKRRALLRAAA